MLLVNLGMGCWFDGWRCKRIDRQVCFDYFIDGLDYSYFATFLNSWLDGDWLGFMGWGLFFLVWVGCCRGRGLRW
jgi:hypothetical protein